MRISFTALFAFVIYISSAQQLEFLHLFNAPWPTQNYQCRTDLSGNIYLSAMFTDSLDIDPGPDTNWLRLPNDKSGFFVAQFTPQGALVWVKVIGGSGGSIAENLFVDPEGFVFVTGNFSGKVDFDPGPDILLLDSFGKPHGFVLKLNPFGALVWAKNFRGAVGSSSVSCLTTDTQGNVYCAGYYGGDVHFNTGNSDWELQSPLGVDAFLAKFDASGQFYWAESIGYDGVAEATHLLCDQAGDIYILGKFYGTLDYDENTKIKSKGGNDIFLGKYPGNGSTNWLWVKTYGGVGDDLPSGITFATTDNQIIISGTFFQTANFNLTGPPYTIQTTAYDGFLMQVNGTGQLDWAKKLNSQGYSEISGMAKTPDGKLLLIGIFNNALTFPDSLNLPPLTSDSTGAAFLLRTHIDGNAEQAFILAEGSYLDVYTYYGYQKNSLAIDPEGNIIATGQYGDVPFFTIGTPLYQPPLINFQSHYFMKISGFTVQTQETPKPKTDIKLISAGNGIISILPPYGPFDLTVFNTAGRMMTQRTKQQGAVNLSYLPTGSYLIQVKCANQQASFKWTHY